MIVNRFGSCGLTFLCADNILVTEGGDENLTPTPKEIDEVVKIIKEG
jgi:Xaa-Pro dipeptidase